MTKFVSAIIASAAVLAAVGCAAETGNSAENSAQDSEAVSSCPNAQGTNAAIAAFATAYGKEAHHWQILADFEEYRGANYQLMLRPKGYPGACANHACPLTEIILGYQDTSFDQAVVYDGEKLSSWNFASRLTTGYDNMKTYAQNHQYPFPAHTIDYVSQAPGTICMTDFTYNATLPTGYTPDALVNALRFSDGNGQNPYLFVYDSAGKPHLRFTGMSLIVDPTGGTSGDPSTGNNQDLTVAGCNAAAADSTGAGTGNITVMAADGTATQAAGWGYPCSCSTRSVSAGKMRNDTQWNKTSSKTYFCMGGW